MVSCLYIIQIFVQQLLDRRAGHRDEVDRTRGQLGFDERRWMPDDQQAGVDSPAAKRGCRRVGLQLRRQLPLLVAPAEFRFEGIPGCSGAGAPAAYIDPFARQACRILNMQIGASHDGNELGIEGHHRAQTKERLSAPRAFAFVGGEVNIGLDDRELEFAGLKRPRYYRQIPASSRASSGLCTY